MISATINSVNIISIASVDVVTTVIIIGITIIVSIIAGAGACRHCGALSSFAVVFRHYH
jgi:hypothetical protein